MGYPRGVRVSQGVGYPRRVKGIPEGVGHFRRGSVSKGVQYHIGVRVFKWGVGYSRGGKSIPEREQYSRGGRVSQGVGIPEGEGYP